jgi:hypothetical protein
MRPETIRELETLVRCYQDLGQKERAERYAAAAKQLRGPVT